MLTKKHKLLIFLTIVSCVACAAVYYFIFTTKGSGFITRIVLSNYVDSTSVDIKEIGGSLSHKLVLQNIEVKDLQWLPQGNSLKIQKLEVHLSSFSIKGLNVNIHNGRLNLPGSEAILFYGNYQNASLDITVYSNVLGVRETLDFFAKSSELKNLSGALGNIDINVKGSFLEPDLNGEFHIEKLSRKAFSMANCPGALRIKLKDIKESLKLYGEILLKSGVISGPKTAIINLKESKILFTGDPRKPALDFKGTSAVGDVKIDIALKGTFDKPDLKLTSKPAMSKDRLLVMLATNRTWQSAETAINKQELSIDLAKDFLEYFIFSGSGDKIAQQYGIRNILVKYDGKTTGIGATKDISDKTSVSYSVEQQQENGKKASTSHKVGSEYKITETISIGAEKELKQDTRTEQTQDGQKTDDKVILKYKKEF